MKIQNKKEIELSTDDIKDIIIKYFARSEDLAASSIFEISFVVKNKPLPHPIYHSDSIDNFVFDGARVVISHE